MAIDKKQNGTNELELIKKIREGDTKLFSKIVLKYQKRIYSLGMYLTGDHTIADDLAQETFLRAYQFLNQFDERSEFYTWLYRIAINISLSYLRKRKKQTTIDPGDPRISSLKSLTNNPDKMVEMKELYEKLVLALDELTPEIKITLLLVTIEGLSHKKVSEIVGCSEGTVSWRVHQARKILREKLGDLLDIII